jgi:dye decolorizing peroxidase
VLVLRRIRMLMEPWDLLDRAVQETVIGRRLDTGAPIGAAHEADPVPFDAVDDLGLPVIAADAHIRVAHAPSKDAMILRRPFNYDDGTRDGGE